MPPPNPPPRKPQAPGVPGARLPRPAVEEGPVLPPRHVERTALPPDPPSVPEASLKPPKQRGIRYERPSTYARAAVSIVELLSRGGGAGRATILMGALAGVLYVLPPVITAAGEQLTATIVASRQPDLASEVVALRAEVAKAVARLHEVRDQVRSDAQEAKRARDTAELLVSEAGRRVEQSRDNDRAALLVAFDQIDWLAGVHCLANGGKGAHDSVHCQAVTRAPDPPGGPRPDQRIAVNEQFALRPERYERTHRPR